MIIINLPYNCDPRRIFTLNMLMAQYYDEGLRIIAFPTEEFSDLYPIDVSICCTYYLHIIFNKIY